MQWKTNEFSYLHWRFNSDKLVEDILAEIKTQKSASPSKSNHMMELINDFGLV